MIKKIGFSVRAIEGADTWMDLPTTTKFKVILYWCYSCPWERLAEVTCVPGAEPCEIRLRPEQGPFYTVRVRVRYPDGSPAAGIVVRINCNLEVTDEEGRGDLLPSQAWNL